jgi:hypothetical protein
MRSHHFLRDPKHLTVAIQMLADWTISFPSIASGRHEHFPNFLIMKRNRVVKPRINSHHLSLASSTRASLVHFPIRNSRYRQTDPRFAPAPDDFFHGICHYIFCQSNHCYNTRELLIEYSDMQPNSDPANLLDYQSPLCFEAGNGPGHCIVLTFRRIAIRPTALALGFGPPSPTCRPPSSYIFEGWHSAWQKWVILAERIGFDGMRSADFSVDAIDTEFEFSKFRFTHTDGSPASHFGLSALEICGRIRVIEFQVPVFKSAKQADDGLNPWTIVRGPKTA